MVKYFWILLTLVAIGFGQNVNDEPVIGVLLQKTTSFLNENYPGHHSFVASSYVKYLEGAGARVVPIWVGKSRSYYEDIMKKVNGILYPGGSSSFTAKNGYADAGDHIYKIAFEMNSKGIYFPLWGTCLGFELLTFLSANRTEHRARCSSLNQALPLEFKPDFQQSRLYENLPYDIEQIFRNEKVTANFHQYCTTEKNLTAFNLDNEWRAMSLNHDKNGFEFISSIEHKQFPFYGVQFHPEKNLYEWVPNKNITHTANAITASQYYAKFFVNECRKNPNRFDSLNEINNHVMYNFKPTFTGSKGSAFNQCYLFEKGAAYPNNTRLRMNEFYFDDSDI